MSYFKPRHQKNYGPGQYVSPETRIQTDLAIIAEIIQQSSKEGDPKQPFYGSISFVPRISGEVKSKIETEFSLEYSQNDEEYIIDIQEDIHVYADSERGLFYGCITLMQLMEKQYLGRALIYDYPVCSVRGVKVYLPGQDNLDYFKKFVDMICHYKYNTIMIEVGGAMEYKNHPEINSGWVEYCKEMSEYSGKTIDIQENTFTWEKNSIHVENGEGNYLSQDVVRNLVDYCKERKLNVIPEVPCLSHCDYLLLNHEEIKERQEDPYPDTYCPSNPKSYELLFDILDEVINVFRPEVINIGHDEYYSIGLCDKCKGKKAEDIYADDIKKIYNYLKQYDVSTMIWGEKLLNSYSKDGRPVGGAEKKLFKQGDEYLCIIPATYKSIDLVPGDIKILHWYWGIDKDFEKEYLKRDMDVTFGNFSGSKIVDWKQRINAGVKGGIISNWSTLKEENLQRNGFLYELVYSARMFWDQDYDEKKYEQLRNQVFSELFAYKYKDLLEQAEDNQYIKILHTTDRRIEYKKFFDGVFIELDTYKLGDYILVYGDGTEAELPIVYGDNITNQQVSWSSRDDLLIEVTSKTHPIQINGLTYCECIYANPCPEKRIQGMYIKKSRESDYNISVKEVVFL